MRANAERTPGFLTGGESLFRVSGLQARRKTSSAWAGRKSYGILFQLAGFNIFSATAQYHTTGDDAILMVYLIVNVVH
jgi:hypothetical protein